jgi:hypothetical protein
MQGLEICFRGQNASESRGTPINIVRMIDSNSKVDETIKNFNGLSNLNQRTEKFAVAERVKAFSCVAPLYVQDVSIYRVFRPGMGISTAGMYLSRTQISSDSDTRSTRMDM